MVATVVEDALLTMEQEATTGLGLRRTQCRSKTQSPNDELGPKLYRREADSIKIFPAEDQTLVRSPGQWALLQTT